MDLRDKLKFWLLLSSYIDMIVKGTSPLSLPDAIADSLSYVKAFGGTEQGLPSEYQLYTEVEAGGVTYTYSSQNLTQIPCMRIADNVFGLYNLITQTFTGDATFTSNGTPITSPSPQYDIPLVSNNGVLKARHQSGLPLGYTLLESATGYANQSIIDSGVAGNNDKLRIVIKAQKETSNNYTPLFANYIDEASNVTRVIAGSSAGSVIFDLNRQSGSSDQVSGVRFTDLHTYDLYKYENGRSVLEIDGEVAGTSPNTQGTANATNISIGNSRVLTQEPSTLSTTYWYFYFCKIYDDGVLIRDYVPVKRNSDNVVGVYDLVNNTFDAGQYPSFAPFSAGNVASDPVEIYTDGTVETINVHGKNLLDLANCTDGYYYSPTGEYKPATSTRLSNFIPVKAGVTYTVFAYGLAGSANVRINLLDTQKNWLSQDVMATILGEYIAISVTPTQDGYLAFSANYITSSRIDWSLSQVVRGEYTVATMPEYTPYYDGGTATAEMLLKVGDYQDVQSIIDGVVTRKVGVLVLDGTEDWVYNNAGTGLLSNMYNLAIPEMFTETSSVTTNRQSPYCTHFKRSTNWLSTNNRTNMVQSYITTGGTHYLGLGYGTVSVANMPQFKQYLADQYAAGDPVIVIYPLATPTTESVTGQTLQVTDGDNVLEITQASLTGLELEAKYQKN